MAELISRAGDETEIKSSHCWSSCQHLKMPHTREHSRTRQSALPLPGVVSLYGMVDAQIGVFERELLTGYTLTF